MNTLKQVLYAYKLCSTKEDKDDVLYHVYDHKIVEELNGNNKVDKMVQLKFKIREIEIAYQSINSRFYYVSKRDLDSYVLVSMHKIFEEKDFDFTKSDKEVGTYFYKTFVGLVHNLIIKEREKVELNDPEQIMTEGKVSEQSRYDAAALQQYNERYVEDTFESFLDEIGSVEKLLTDKELDVYYLKQSDMLEIEIAERLNCTQQAVNKTYRRAINKIERKYKHYRLTRIACKAPDTFTTIANYVKSYNDILACADVDTFNFFKYTYNFLKENHRFYNDRMSSYTVIDALYDNLRPHEQDLFRNVVASFDNDKLTFTKREQGRIVMITNRIMQSHVDNTYAAIEDISNDVTHDVVNKFYEN